MFHLKPFITVCAQVSFYIHAPSVWVHAAVLDQVYSAEADLIKKHAL